jgi:septum site-determining protein MinC
MNAPAKPSLHRGRGLRLNDQWLNVSVLTLYQYDATQFPLELAEKVETHPEAFQYRSVLLDLQSLSSSSIPDFDDIKQRFAEHAIQLLGVITNSDVHFEAADTAELMVIDPENLDKEEVTRQKALSQSVVLESKMETVAQTIAEASHNKVITTPVRSGQQVFAPLGDLIVLAPVSAGAEILAAGNIHVYGPLRGRALAGVKGDTSARIFCHQLEAELVSIAGQYKISEDLQSENWKKAVQISLIDEKLLISELIKTL